MRTRLVFWGLKGPEEKVLIAIGLNEEENQVDVYIFPEENTTEEFVTQMHQKWRLGEELLLPEPHEHHQKQLSISESMLPDGFSVDREDILKRAQTEWHFIVLSSKMFNAYLSEIEDFKEKAAKLTQFDSELWEELKGFWSRVQQHVRENNLFRDHANTLRERTNELFSDLKELRKELDKEFNEFSEEHLNSFMDKLKGIEAKIEEGLSLQPIFEELKEIQRKFRNVKFTRDHRSLVWQKLDGLFKKVKEKKFGPGATRRTNPLERVSHRYDGLIKAIEKMERSIHRDRKDLDFQNQRVEKAEGSLEAQIRVAKIKMIEERINSKEEKLTEMHKTRTFLEQKIEALKAKEEKMQEKERFEETKEEVKKEIEREIKEAEKARKIDKRLQKAAESIKEDKDKDEEPSLKEKIKDGVEDLVDTVKAIVLVIEDEIDDAVGKQKGDEEE